MPALRTEITEIITGLATLGYHSLDRALEVRPRHITHVDDDVFERLEAARRARSHEAEFSVAWANGLVFAQSDQGLRGRPPWSLEWKGHHRPASRSIETIPADLRVDHVYLISCKYGSEILHNSSPFQLFDHLLRTTAGRGRDWYDVVAPALYRAVWEPAHRRAGVDTTVPPTELAKPDRDRLRRHLADHPIETDSTSYREFIAMVSARSADRWRAAMASKRDREEMMWRLLRMQAAPYFVLGATRRRQPVRYRVCTPWDFAQSYELGSFDVTAGSGGQPTVHWSIEVVDRSTNETRRIDGYVEVRWSHGKLRGTPEAKVHLTTNPHSVPGHIPLQPPTGLLL